MFLITTLTSLVGFLAIALFSGLMGNGGSSIIASFFASLGFFLFTVYYFESSLSGSFSRIKVGCWVKAVTCVVGWGWLLDSLSVALGFLVCFISLAVHVYTLEYMSHDPHLPRFISYLSVFTFFMIVLITADNFLQMFLGWEGVGLCSYLLINFWFARVQANKAAIKAMLHNRVGDLSLLLSLFFVMAFIKSLEYSLSACLSLLLENRSVFLLSQETGLPVFVGFLVFGGVVGKSAQLGLHAWLPDAMEGPTPVSALIHAATMVTAGVFLVVRVSFFFELSSTVLLTVSTIGALTSFFAASVGACQSDYKKVIAYSTCSQLGYMVFACGLSNYSTSVYHLVNHGFFKALLFLGAGVVIHALKGEQDIRRMGGVRKLIPLTYGAVFAASLSLAGFPFLSGFYSKDLLLELSLWTLSRSGLACCLLGFFAATLTAAYSTKLLCVVFLEKPKGYSNPTRKTSEAFGAMLVVLCFLALPSVLSGFLLQNIFLNGGLGFFGSSIRQVFRGAGFADVDFSLALVPWVVLFLCLSAALAYLGFALLRSRAVFSRPGFFYGKVLTFLNRKWFFDRVLNRTAGQSFFRLGYSVNYKQLDKGLFEFLGPKGFSYVLSALSVGVSKLRQGGSQSYIYFAGLVGFFSLWVSLTTPAVLSLQDVHSAVPVPSLTSLPRSHIYLILENAAEPYVKRSNDLTLLRDIFVGAEDARRQIPLGGKAVSLYNVLATRDAYSLVESGATKAHPLVILWMALSVPLGLPDTRHRTAMVIVHCAQVATHDPLQWYYASLGSKKIKSLNYLIEDVESINKTLNNPAYHLQVAWAVPLIQLVVISSVCVLMYFICVEAKSAYHDFLLKRKKKGKK